MTDQTNDPYRPPPDSPPERESTKQKRSIVYIVSCVAWCALAVTMTVVRPITFAWFEDFGVELPLLTVWLLHPASSYLFFLIAGGMISLVLFVENPPTRRRIGWITLVFAMFTALIMIVGIGLPVLRLMQALS